VSRAPLRRRLFRTLFLVALLPAGLTLVLGALVLREIVGTTGSAGPWLAVAETGRELLDLLREADPSPELADAAAAHRAVLSESVRLSAVLTLLGERIVVLIPVAAFVLMVLVAAVAAAATHRLAGSLAAPAEELAGWIRSLGAGIPLPPDGPGSRKEPAEFQALRAGLREAEHRLAEARRKEAERIRERSWAEMSRRVAHEIKNPLTPMRMAAERVAGSDDTRSAEAGRILLEEIGRLDGLARTFSHFGRPVEGPAAPVDLVELLAGLAGRFEDREVAVEMEESTGPLVVLGHLEALERVVRNLVNNALESRTEGAPAGRSRPGGEAPSDGPCVRVRLHREAGDAVIRVEDRGPGIPPELVDRIWEPDFTTRRKGTGLGLPLVRQAVRSHGGRVEVSNLPEGGARFEVRLPLEAPP
jgi:signal transduction histidine kinase